MMSHTATKLDVYTAGTPNGHKIHFVLEELGLNYTAHKIDLATNAQKEDWFLKINPNGRIPAIIDRTHGGEKCIFEGGAILLYLCARYDPEHLISFPYDSDEYWQSIEWLIWMQSGIGPIQGQANHFYRYAPTKIEYAINRYQGETKRLYQVLEDRLKSQEAQGKGLWTVGGKYSIADIACFSWINWAEWAGVDTKSFPKIQQWAAEIDKRPATQKAVNIPEKFLMKESMKNKESEEAYAKYNTDWVMKGQEADQKKHL